MNRLAIDHVVGAFDIREEPYWIQVRWQLRKNRCFKPPSVDGGLAGSCTITSVGTVECRNPLCITSRPEVDRPTTIGALEDVP